MTLGVADTATLAVGTGVDTGKIMLNGVACGAATVMTTDTIAVTGSTGAETVTIDLGGGPFAPGLTPEAGDVAEIEFTVDLAAGTTDRLNITGSASADSIVFGTAGANLNGDRDVDVTLANTALFTVNAGAGADTLSGAGAVGTGAAFATALTLNGEGDNDTLLSGAANDTLNGGEGTDTADYSRAPAYVVVNLATTTAQNTLAAGTDTLVALENLTGSAFGDTLTGDGGANVFVGGDGGDTIAGGAGNDVIDEGAVANGGDSLSGGGGLDTLSYAARTSSVYVTADSLGDDGEAGEGDTVVADLENLVGGTGDDTLSATSLGLVGGAVQNVITGGNGNDLLHGGLGNDTLDGGAGTDTLDYSSATATLTINLSTGVAVTTGTGSVGAGTDLLVGAENVLGGGSNDIIIGDSGQNKLLGGDGNDTLRGEGGDDQLDGGGDSFLLPGVDIVEYSTATGGAVVNLTTGSGTAPGAGTDTLVNFEHVTGSRFNDTLTGDRFINTLTGLAGDDTLAGLAGADTLEGGDGTNTADYSAAPSGVTVNLNAPSTAGAAGADVLVSIHNVRGSAFRDVLFPSGADNVLSGGGGTDVVDYSFSLSGVVVDLATGSAGVRGGDMLFDVENVTGSPFNDTLQGDAGSNVIIGGAGNDRLVGREGDDTLDGGAGIDTADYSDASRRVTVNLTTGASAGGAGVDSLTAVENLTGSRFADRLVGDAGSNVLAGEEGADTLQGLQGNDVFRGGRGRDTADFSRASASTSPAGGVAVNLATGTASGEGSDALASIENVVGSDWNDRLTGSRVANKLWGGGGNDTLTGGRGRDLLSGGDGNDRFQARDGARDRVLGGRGRDRGTIDRRDRVASLEQRS